MSASDRITSYILSHLEKEPYRIQGQFYRDLAELTVDDQRAARLRAMAIRADELSLESSQLRLDLRDHRDGQTDGQRPGGAQ